ncbi:MAG: hypothetical protein K2J82_00285 [Muribaculaceae bacterium]|nr:hypothetical protein [Muribaculaceae bacterium]MDE6753030.1 hypothetical protein [Muribaculaceae bacterium]
MSISGSASESDAPSATIISATDVGRRILQVQTERCLAIPDTQGRGAEASRL